LALDGLSPTAGFPVLLALLSALVLCDLLFAAALSALFRGGLMGFQVTVLLGMLSLMLSGLTWPWDAIPAPLRAVAATIPFTPFGQAMRTCFQVRPSVSDLAGPLEWMGLQALACLGLLALSSAAGELVARARRTREGVRS
jgi:ABC-2 type transport system permease protein